MSEKTISERDAAFDEGSSSLEMLPVALDVTSSSQEVDLSELNDDLVKFLQDDSVRDDLIKGVDLQQYSRDIEQQLKKAEEASILDYIKNADKIASLYETIECFDSVLGRMQTVLSGFQTHLGSISSEIKSLQEESLSMNMKIKNRKQTLDEVSDFVDNIALPKDFVIGIYESEINENYIELLETLRKKEDFVKLHSSAQAASDTVSALNDMSACAASRIREFLLNQVYALQTPKTNIQIKQSVISKFKKLFGFLSERDCKSANEIRDAYKDIMGKIYFELMKKYVNELVKLLQKDVYADKNDLIAIETEKTGGIFSSKKSEAHLINVFTLGTRVQSLKDIEEEVRLHVAINNNEGLFFEDVFAGTSRLLMNTCISEYLFTVDFFGNKDIFTTTMTRTLSFFQDFVKQHISACYNVVEMLLICRILYQNQLFMNSRRVDCLSSLFEKLNSLFWSKFEALMVSHVSSLTRLTTMQPKRSSLVHSFFVCRRYAELSYAITILNRDYKDEIVYKLAEALRRGVDEFFTMSSSLLTGNSDRSVYLIRLYDIITRVYQCKGVVSNDYSHFENLIKDQIDLYIESALCSISCFKKMIEFVKSHDITKDFTEGKDASSSRIHKDMVDEIVSLFSTTWSSGIADLNQQIMENFSKKWIERSVIAGDVLSGDRLKELMLAIETPQTNQRSQESYASPTSMLKQAFSQLVNYYNKFTTILQNSDVPVRITKNLVQTHNLLFEIKKYVRSK